MNPLTKLLDALRPDDVIDSFFIQTDLKEINMSDAELAERAQFDSMCDNIKIDKNIPIGKQVR